MKEKYIFVVIEQTEDGPSNFSAWSSEELARADAEKYNLKNFEIEGLPFNDGITE